MQKKYGRIRVIVNMDDSKNRWKVINVSSTSSIISNRSRKVFLYEMNSEYEGVRWDSSQPIEENLNSAWKRKFSAFCERANTSKLD